MTATGRIRGVDGLGRIVIPKEIRKKFEIQDNVDMMEIYTQGNTIILKKYEPCCTFCGEGKDVLTFQGRRICAECLKALKKIEYKEK